MTQYIRRRLDLSISAAISSIIPLHNKFGQGFQVPSIKYQQCQITLSSSLKSSCDATITKLWRTTNRGANIQYDMYKNTKQALKSIRDDHTFRLETQLQSQGFIISFIFENSLQKLNSLLSKANSKVPANIFNFTIKYLSGTLPTRKNLHLWSLSTTSDCSFCLQPESLLHVVAGCKTYLNEGRFTWRQLSFEVSCSNTAIHKISKTLC